MVRVYNLAGVSGKAVMDHPEAKAMLADLAADRIHVLIFSKLARLASNTKELFEFAEHFETHSADFVSLAESIDTSTPAGHLFYTILAAMSQWEREEIADRVRASVPIRAKLGKSLGGAAPFGYEWKESKLAIKPTEALVRVHVYEFFREHRRLKTVARLLNEASYRMRSGAKFSDTTVARILKDPVSKGQRRANYSRSRGTGKHWDYEPESEWVWIPVEPVVSEELWNDCNAALQSRERKPRVTKRPVHLFTGLVFCEAGHKMTVPQNQLNTHTAPAKCESERSILRKFFARNSTAFSCPRTM